MRLAGARKLTRDPIDEHAYTRRGLAVAWIQHGHGDRRHPVIGKNSDDAAGRQVVRDVKGRHLHQPESEQHRVPQAFGPGDSQRPVHFDLSLAVPAQEFERDQCSRGD